MATIRMLKTAATSDYTYAAPQIYAGVPLERAKTLVDAGAAVFVTEPVEQAVIEVSETREDPRAESEIGAWPMKMEPERYLERFPEGKHAGLARRLLGA